MTKFVQYTRNFLAIEEMLDGGTERRERESELLGRDKTERRGKGKAAPSDTALAVGATKEW